ncbi:hypothetical protein AWH48_11435 [Domibacillus aminovorans]|uniref:LexA repressor DNA-binding domain-containing protein n=1 Tax=Domibacillus aminovorans TaxID=29332 RepID=A0A177KLV5_9BACI|nr:hypothetical protein [Domibacillus aminovorans]OAH53875.1 hypothetical protein AWH48_11435 [Domibacillus aminovorans]
MHLTKRERETLAFVRTYQAEHAALPTYKRIGFALGGVGESTVGRYMQTLRKAGLINYKSKKKRVEKQKEVTRIENKPVQKVVDVVRSGVHELSRAEIEQKAYTVDLMTARLSDGMEWQFLFTVDRHRGYDEYERIKQQRKATGYSRYGNSLFCGMFKNW